MKRLKVFFCLLMLIVLGLLAGTAMAAEPLEVIVVDVFAREYIVLGGSGSHEVVSATVTDYSGNVLLNSTNPKQGHIEFEYWGSYTFAITVRDTATGEMATDELKDYYQVYDSYRCDCDKYGHDESEWSNDTDSEYYRCKYPDSKILAITETECSGRRAIAYYCVCDYCQAYLRTEFVYWTEKHRFDERTGICWVCGYTTQCPHENTVHISNKKSYPKIIDEYTHITQEWDVRKCKDCGETVELLLSEKEYKHTFQSSRVSDTKPRWCYCGYETDMKAFEVLSVELSNTNCVLGESVTCTVAVKGGSGDMSYMFTYRDANGEFVEQNHDESLAEPTWTFTASQLGYCTLKVNISDNYLNTWSQQEITFHVTCPDQHTPVLSSSYEDVQYSIDETNLLGHNKITRYYDKYVCSQCQYDCGEMLMDEVTQWEDHTFSGSVCSACKLNESRIRDCYSLCCPYEKYGFQPTGTYLIGENHTVDLRIRDNHTGAIYRVSEMEGMSLDCKLGKNMTLSSDGRLWIKKGTVEVKLRYNGRQLDSITVGTSWLDVPTWGVNEGLASGTLYLRLEDLQGVAWDKTGVWLNRGNELSIGMFEFKAKHSGDFYNVSFEIYNGTPITFGVISYYPDGRECDRQLIQAYSPDWSLGHAIWQMGQVAVDTFSAKYGNSGFHTEKTDVSIRVPEGGAFLFVEASQDAEVAMQNVVEMWMSIVVNSGEYLDAIFPGDAVSQKAVKKGLEGVDGWRTFRNAVVGEMIDAMDVEDGTLGTLSAKDVLSLTKTGTKFALDLLKKDEIKDVLLEAVKKLAVSTTLSALDKAVTKILTGTYGTLAFEMEAMLIEHGYMMQHLDALQAYSFESFDLIQWEMVIMPVD